MSTLRIVLAVAVLGAILCSPAAAAVAYSVTDLGTFYPQAINNLGQVVGFSPQYIPGFPSTNNAVLYNNGTVTTIGPGIAYGTNDKGQIVGSNGSAVSYAKGTATSFPFDGGSTAFAINNSGQVVGYTLAGNAFLYSNGNMTTIAFNAVAFGINGTGQVVGWTNGTSRDACLWNNGTTMDFGAGQAYGINNNGQVVGYLDTDQGSKAFLYTNDKVTNLGGGVANGINASGQVVGVAGFGAFLYCNGTMTDLNSLLSGHKLNNGNWL